MWSWAGVSVDWNKSPVTPSIAAAATDRACTSSPTLVRSVNTVASHNCRIGRANYPAGFPVDLALKDIRLFEGAEGYQRPLVHAVEERLQHAVDAGHPNDDLAAVAAVD
jgi:3-hydroxyisobutyrate dehydrogenase-like beta-hydroxyacid dehydrogenase